MYPADPETRTHDVPLPRLFAGLVIPSAARLPVELPRRVLGFARRPHGRFAFVEDERLQASGYGGSLPEKNETGRMMSGRQGLPTCGTVAPTVSQRLARFHVFRLRSETYVRISECQMPSFSKSADLEATFQTGGAVFPRSSSEAREALAARPRLLGISSELRLLRKARGPAG